MLPVSHSDDFSEKFLCVERNKRVKVAFARQSSVEAQQKCVYNKRNHKAPYIESVGHYQQKNTAEFKAVAEFVVGLGVVCNGDKCHI